MWPQWMPKHDVVKISMGFNMYNIVHKSWLLTGSVTVPDARYGRYQDMSEMIA